MNHASSIAHTQAPDHRPDSRKAPRLKAELIDRGPLSPKEALVLAKLAEGLSKKQIAQRVNRSLSTINTQLEHIYRKLGARSATHAVGIAVSKGIVGLSILTLLVAIQVDNKNLIRPRSPIKTGRTASARTKRETESATGIGSDAAGAGNYCVAAVRDSRADSFFEYRGSRVDLEIAGENTGLAGQKLIVEAAHGGATQPQVA